MTDDRAMTPHELREALQLKPSTFYKHQAAGRYARFELVPRIGPRRYSRALVQGYLNREAPGRRLAIAKAG
jgi:hypothetical protein